MSKRGKELLAFFILLACVLVFGGYLGIGAMNDVRKAMEPVEAYPPFDEPPMEIIVEGEK